MGPEANWHIFATAGSTLSFVQDPIFDLNAELEESHWWFVGRRTIIRGIVTAVFPPRAGRRVIDIGCGTGANIASFAADYDVTGYDLSQKAIGYARKRFPDVDFVLDDAAKHLAAIEPRNGGVNHFLLLNDVLEHIEDDYAFLNTIVDSAPTAAWLLITVPADPELWSNHDESHGHFRRYTRDSLQALLDSVDVDVVYTTHFNTRLYPLVKLIRKATAMVGGSFGASDSDLSRPPAIINGRLTAIFASELDAILDAIEDDPVNRGPVFDKGVSLLALVRISDRRD